MESSIYTEYGQASLPFDIIIEILCMLEPKCLVKLQLVCKEWQSIIYGAYFADKYENRTAFFQYILLHTVKDPSEKPYPQAMRANNYYKLGLHIVWCYDVARYALWNPSLNQHLQLPNSHSGSLSCALTYLSATRTYKVLSVYKDKDWGSQGCEVFSPDEDKWRRLESYPGTMQITDGQEENYKFAETAAEMVSTGEEVHIFRHVNRDIVTVDMRTESFTVTSWPKFWKGETIKKLSRNKSLRHFMWNEQVAIGGVIGENLHVYVFGERKKYVWGDEKIIKLRFLKKENYEAAHLIPLFLKDSGLWLWVEGEKVIIYNMDTGLVIHLYTDPPVTLFPPYDKFMPFKAGLGYIKGMRPGKPFQDKV